jgi:hypothetical protein
MGWASDRPHPFAGLTYRGGAEASCLPVAGCSLESWNQKLPVEVCRVRHVGDEVEPRDKTRASSLMPFSMAIPFAIGRHRHGLGSYL